jgi:hypothetical protein
LEECVQGRQAVVPRPGTVAAHEFKVFEELSQESCIEILHAQLRGGASQAFGCESEQQAEGVPISSYCVGACVKLLLQSIGKEKLHK